MKQLYMREIVCVCVRLCVFVCCPGWAWRVKVGRLTTPCGLVERRLRRSVSACGFRARDVCYPLHGARAVRVCDRAGARDWQPRVSDRVRVGSRRALAHRAAADRADAAVALLHAQRRLGATLDWLTARLPLCCIAPLLTAALVLAVLCADGLAVSPWAPACMVLGAVVVLLVSPTTAYVLHACQWRTCCGQRAGVRSALNGADARVLSPHRFIWEVRGRAQSCSVLFFVSVRFISVPCIVGI